MNRNLILVFVLIFSLFLVISSAFIISDTYKIRGVISGGGHVNLTSTGYLTKIAIGQPVIGNTSGGGYKICFGIFCTGTFEPQYNINLSGILNYSNGTPVVNAQIKITIKYPTLQFEKSSTTDGSGKFIIIISNIPESLIGKDFYIEIYVLGEVEAVYQNPCIYDEIKKEYKC